MLRKIEHTHPHGRSNTDLVSQYAPIQLGGQDSLNDWDLWATRLQVYGSGVSNLIKQKRTKGKEKKIEVKRGRSKAARVQQAQRIIDDKKAKQQGTYYSSGIRIFGEDATEGTTTTGNPKKKRRTRTPTRCGACGETGHRRDNKNKCAKHPAFIPKETNIGGK